MRTDLPIPTSRPEAFLRALFDIAVAAADPMIAVPAALPAQRPQGRVIVVGAGKASARMAEAVESVWGPCEGLVITRYGHARPCRGIEVVEAAHPVPDEAGVAATERMLSLLEGAGEGDFVLALISGGGSALLCAPASGLTLQDKQAVNAALLASGAPIDQMNLVRKHLSRVKGGQLAATAFPAQTLTLAISDVPGDAPEHIASGPTVPEASNPQDAADTLARYGVPITGAVAAALKGPARPVPPGDLRLSRAQTRVIAAPAQSLGQAARAAENLCMVQVLGDALEGEARELGAALARRALDLHAGMHWTDRPALILSGGEVTVTRRGAGTGGPNAETMLAAAITLHGATGIHALACDTDGIDGAAEVAGAVIGPDMPSRAAAVGLTMQAALDDNDAHSFFAKTGNQVVTGPTLTNVNDFRAFLILPPER